MSKVIFQDQIGRVVVGDKVEETETTLTVSDPKFIHAEMGQDNRIGMHVIPVFFSEVVEKGEGSKNNWVYNKSSIIFGDVTVSKDLLDKCDKINKPIEQPPVSNDANVISIDDL